MHFQKLNLDGLDFDDIILKTDMFMNKMDVFAFMKRFENYNDEDYNFKFKK